MTAKIRMYVEMPSRYGERRSARSPSHGLPPITARSFTADGPSPPGAASTRPRAGRRCATTVAESAAPQSDATATSNSPAVPIDSARREAIHGPVTAPNVPPTAITPNNRFPSSSEKVSAINPQKSIVTKRLNTLYQTKKTIPLVLPMVAGLLQRSDRPQSVSSPDAGR